MKIAFYTLGCKVNQYETEVLKTLFVQKGWEITDWEEEAQAYVINSCTVTSTGDKKARQVLHGIRKRRQESIIAFIGCLPQALSSKEIDLPEADIIIGTSNRYELPDLFEQYQNKKEKIISVMPFEKESSFENITISNFSNRSRAFVKIQDGCENYCTYCIIPKARGPIRSKPLDLLKTEVEALAKNGYCEIVLVGINLTSYGADLEKTDIIDAVRTAASVNGIERIRLSSLEPESLSAKHIYALSKISKFCPHFHLSLQSGADSVLKRMNRRYSTKDYKKIIESIRKHFDNPAITTDIIVGFPGETEWDFAQSVAFVSKIKFSKVHIFPYSVRPNTPAANLPDQLSRAQKQRRAKTMSIQTEKVQNDFYNNQIGTIHEVLFETQRGSTAIGYTKNYMPVYVKSEEDLVGSIRKVEIIAVQNDNCRGTLIRI